MDPNTLAQQYVQQTINSFLPFVSGAPTSFEQNNPFSNYFNAGSDVNAQKSLFDPYYQYLLNNYNAQSNLRNQNYGNIYNTDTNYYNQSHQNFLNYQNKLYQNNMANLMGSLQGNGVGSSSEANNAAYNANNDFNNTIAQNNLDTQHNLQGAQNTYSYNTQSNELDKQLNQFNQAQNEAKDINSAVNTDQNNAYQRYQTMMNNYYNNYNYSKLP